MLQKFDSTKFNKSNEVEFLFWGNRYYKDFVVKDECETDIIENNDADKSHKTFVYTKKNVYCKLIGF